MSKRLISTTTAPAVPGKRTQKSKKLGTRRYVGPANGLRACLLRGVGPEILLRVYHDGAKLRFTDYDIWHNDLWVTIAPDAMAGLYKITGGGTECSDVIDHSPEVLGLDATGRREVRTLTTKFAMVSKVTRGGVQPQKPVRRGR